MNNLRSTKPHEWGKTARPDNSRNSHGFTRHNTPPKKTTDTVINLSDQKLEDGVASLLQKGLNFAVTPRYIPIEDVLAGVEKVSNYKPDTGELP